MNCQAAPDGRVMNQEVNLEASGNHYVPIIPAHVAHSDDLTARVQESGAGDSSPFDKSVAYERLFQRVARILYRRPFAHVLLTGERAVGKSQIVAELARRAAIGTIACLADVRFLYVDCRHVAQDESRLRLLAILAHVADHPQLVVCIDGLASLLRAEPFRSNKSVLLANLGRTRCHILGLLTPREFDEVIADDPDFAEFFTRVDVEEPDLETGLKLLQHFALGLQDRYQVEIEPEAVRQAVLLSSNYILNDHLPAKALKLLARACEDLDYDRSQLGSQRERVTAEDVVNLVAQHTGVPEETLCGIAERSDYEESLREVIFGQDHAVHEVATELGLIKAGMSDPNKPASVMLFLGQTGTGKTEMAKALARFYSTSKKLKTYTLGNCVEPHSVATIIGVPPGYVGTDQGGRLINELNADPYCVFLLDEADKAHPDVLQPFLNLFDEGWVCDQRGVKAYANHAIFILTSNVGQRMIAQLVKEGMSPEEIATRMKEALGQIRHPKAERPVFSPEFLARIKRIIVFKPLDQAAMDGICRKLVTELCQSWAEKRGKRLEIPETLIAYIAEQANRLNEKSQGKEGGRIVRKLMADWLEAPLQRVISDRPGEYRGCQEIVLEFTAPGPVAAHAPPPAPVVAARFIKTCDLCCLKDSTEQREASHYENKQSCEEIPIRGAGDRVA
jgi:ATP-dependent Clp protease ATP-binding subunit ClpC